MAKEKSEMERVVELGAGGQASSENTNANTNTNTNTNTTATANTGRFNLIYRRTLCFDVFSGLCTINAVFI